MQQIECLSTELELMFRLLWKKERFSCLRLVGLFPLSGDKDDDDDDDADDKMQSSVLTGGEEGRQESQEQSEVDHGDFEMVVSKEGCFWHGTWHHTDIRHHVKYKWWTCFWMILLLVINDAPTNKHGLVYLSRYHCSQQHINKPNLQQEATYSVTCSFHLCIWINL